MPTFPTIPFTQIASFYARHQNRIVLATTLLLAAILAVQAAKIVWLFIPTPENARWQPPPVVAQPAPSATPLSSLSAIVQAQLFGSYSASDSGNASSAPETRLDLKLIGILAGSRKDDSRAIIQRQGSPETTYAIGDDIVNDVSLHSIYADRVVLTRNGQLETLRLDPTASGAPSAINTPAVTYGSLPEQLAQARTETLQDPSKAAEYVRVRPNNINNKLNGYRIYPGKNPAVFSGAGLNPGDLVTAVNGVPLDNGQKALQMLNDLSKADSVNLTIDRGGQSLNIFLSFH